MRKSSYLLSGLGLIFTAYLLALAGQRPPAVVDVVTEPGNDRGTLDDTLIIRTDDNRPAYAFNYPDPYGDDLRNMLFQAPDCCRVLGVDFAFLTRDYEGWTTGDPDLVTKLWLSGDDLLPVFGTEIVSHTTPFETFGGAVFDISETWDGNQLVRIDLSEYGVVLSDTTWFHIGYTAIRNSDDDTLTILGDAGSSGRWASEYYQGAFVPMNQGWPATDLFIRVVIETLEPDTGTAGEVRVLAPGPAREFALHGAYPNPFNAEARVVFDVPQPGAVNLRVFDLLGRERAVLTQGVLSAGRYETRLDASGWSTGAYFVRLQAAGQTATQRILLVR